MLQNISIFHFLIFAVGVGFAAALIYTNIQRTALSKFITFLINNNCFSQESSVTLDVIGLNMTEKRIISSAVTKMHGMKRCISIVKSETESNDKLERLLDNPNEDKYFLTDRDTDSLMKKYSFKTMPARLIIMFIAALIAVVIAMTAAVDWLINFVTTPKMEDTGDKTNQTEQTDSEQQTNENSDYVNEIPSDITPDTDTKPSGPRIPV